MPEHPSAVFARQLGETVANFKKDRDRHKYGALWLKMATSILGAVATVLLGWNSSETLAPHLRNAALASSALITVVAAYDAFFEPRKLWVRETFILNSLRDLVREYEIRTAVSELAPEEVENYSERFHLILNAGLNDWVKDKNAGS